MRVVLDTNVLIRTTPASLGGPAWEVLQRLLHGGHTVVMAQPLWAELLEVFERPDVRAVFQITDDQLSQFLRNLEKAIEVVELSTNAAIEVPHDPKDVPVLATAVCGLADVLCTRDRHLRHHDVLAICQAAGIRVLSDTDLLNELRAAEPGE